MSTVLSIATEPGFVPSDALEARIAAAVRGDRQALEEVLMSVERRVYTLAWRLIGDPSAAEDITQEVLIRIAENLRRYRPESNFQGWVCRITANQVHDFRRAFRRPSVTVERTAEYDGEREQQLARVQEALAVLTPKERDAIVMLDIEGYSSGEAASILGTLSITVRTRAAHARKKLRKYLSRYYPELEGQV
jgi:RNA polymerase sigma-70 factor, ECF subfamily